MAIDTNNEKLALIQWLQVWEAGLPMVSTDTIDQADKQQLLLGYPGILWNVAAALTFVFDLNTRLRVFLADYYSTAEDEDLQTLVVSYLEELSDEDWNNRMLQLIDDATAAMA